MIREVDEARLEFERIVIEEVSASMAKHGFALERTFHLSQGHLVQFIRERQTQRERIRFSRYLYDEEQVRTGTLDDGSSFEAWLVGKKRPVDDEVDRAPDRPNFEQMDRYWVSRHLLGISFSVDETTHSRMNKDGSLYMKAEDEWWYFADEAALRQLLRGLLPLVLKVGLRKFDDDLEDLPRRRESQRRLYAMYPQTEEDAATPA